MPINNYAAKLFEAREKRTPIAQLSSFNPSFSVEEAYEVQRALLAKDLSTGKNLSGFKMGLTSVAKQRDVGVFEAIHGYLTADMELKPGKPLDTGTRIHPRVEPEIAVVFRNSPSGATQIKDLLPHLDFVGAALEILDSRYANFKFSLPDVIADNTSASGYVLGNKNYRDRIEELPLFGTVLALNGEVVETGTPAAVLGHPLQSVLQLIQRLSRTETPIKSGYVVLTGGITASMTVKVGDRVKVLMPDTSIQLSVI